VILDSEFQRVQIVTRQCATSNHVGLISCSETDGKVQSLKQLNVKSRQITCLFSLFNLGRLLSLTGFIIDYFR
jgi:hypothetical protein